MYKINNRGQYVSIRPEDRFWDKVEKTETCWIWKGAKNSDGYGILSINGLNYRAHRLVLEMSNSKLPVNSVVCHHCDNKLCVNPLHLFIGTQRDNMRDMRNKNRQSNFFNKGFLHPKSRFTQKDILEIKKLQGILPQWKIAQKYKVSQQTISKILTGRRYQS